MPLQRLDRSHRQHRAQCEADIGGIEVVHQRRRQHERQPLPAMLLWRRQGHPAAIDKGSPGRLEALGHRNRAIVPTRADRIADTQERCELTLGQRRCAFEHRVHHLGIRPVRQIADPDDGVQDEPLIRNRRSEAHGASLDDDGLGL